MSQRSPRLSIAVMGTGGLGGYFGAMLARAGQDVTFIARGQQLEAMRAHGLQILSPRGDFKVEPVQVTDDPRKVGSVDLILFCVKAYDVDAALHLIKPMIGRETAVLPVQNGIEHIALMQAALGAPHVLGGLSMVNAHREAPGVVRHGVDTSPLQLEFGEWPTGISARCAQIEARLVDAGLTAVATPSIAAAMWRKLAFISGICFLAVLRGPIASVWSPEAESIARHAVAETVAVAAAAGMELADNLPDLFDGFNTRVPPSYKPSILVDLEHGNRLELEALTGVVTRLGRKLGVPTPVNDVIYAALKPYAGGGLEPN